MKNLTIGFLLLVALSLPVLAQTSADQTAIRKIMDDQAAAWNRGDLEREQGDNDGKDETPDSGFARYAGGVAAEEGVGHETGGLPPRHECQYTEQQYPRGDAQYDVLPELQVRIPVGEGEVKIDEHLHGVRRKVDRQPGRERILVRKRRPQKAAFSKNRRKKNRNKEIKQVAQMRRHGVGENQRI